MSRIADILALPKPTSHDLHTLTRDIAALPTPTARAEATAIARELLQRRYLTRARSDFYFFCQKMRPGYIKGAHLELLCEKLDAVADGRIKRLIIAMPPRHSKSVHSSILFPSYMLGRDPTTPIIAASHTADLATGFGRQVRDLLETSAYQEVFPSTLLRADIKAAGQWSTDKGGAYYAAGVGGALAGRGAGLLILDDLIDEQKALEAQTRPEVFQKVYDWYLLARQRLMPGGSIILCATRWGLNDPTGLILENSSEEWDVLSLPAIWPDGRTLWPEFWSTEEIHKLRDEMPPLRWSATYQQAPEEGGGTLVEREWIKSWEKEKPPPNIREIIVTIDPAFSEDTRADPTGVVVTGIFDTEDEDSGENVANIIVLDAYETRQDFPDLKRTMFDLYKEWRPEVMLIEDKASGIPLVQELNAIGIPVQAYKVTRGKARASNDKIARLNAVLSVIRSGKLWVPVKQTWAEKFINQLVKFPMVSNDDLVDGITMALSYFRNGGYVTVALDNELFIDEEEEPEYSFGGYANILRG